MHAWHVLGQSCYIFADSRPREKETPPYNPAIYRKGLRLNNFWNKWGWGIFLRHRKKYKMGTIFGRPKWRQKFTQIIGLRCEDKKKIVLSSSSFFKEWGFRDLAKKKCVWLATKRFLRFFLLPLFFSSALIRKLRRIFSALVLPRLIYWLLLLLPPFEETTARPAMPDHTFPS